MNNFIFLIFNVVFIVSCCVQDKYNLSMQEIYPSNPSKRIRLEKKKKQNDLEFSIFKNLNIDCLRLTLEPCDVDSLVNLSLSCKFLNREILKYESKIQFIEELVVDFYEDTEDKFKYKRYPSRFYRKATSIHLQFDPGPSTDKLKELQNENLNENKDKNVNSSKSIIRYQKCQLSDLFMKSSNGYLNKIISLHDVMASDMLKIFHSTKSLKNLEMLSFSLEDLYDLEYIKNLHNFFPKLCHLRINNGDLTDDIFEYFIFCFSLECLVLDYFHESYENDIKYYDIYSFGKLPNLEDLFLEFDNFNRGNVYTTICFKTDNNKSKEYDSTIKSLKIATCGEFIDFSSVLSFPKLRKLELVLTLNIMHKKPWNLSFIDKLLELEFLYIEFLDPEKFNNDSNHRFSVIFNENINVKHKEIYFPESVDIKFI